MKNTLFTFILIAVLCCLYSDIYAQSSPCGPGADCQNPTSGIITETVILPNFPNCPITVRYRWNKCTNPDKVWLRVLKFSIPFDAACSTLRDYLYPNGISIDQSHANEILDDVTTQVSIKYFLQEYAAAAPWNKANFECPNKIEYIRGTKQACINFILTLRYGPFGIPIFYDFDVVSCTETMCCVKKYSICYNTTTQTTEVQETWEWLPENNDCVYTTPPLPSGATAQSGCFAPCH